VSTQPYGDNPSIRKTAALDHPTRQILLLLSGNPSCNPKKIFTAPFIRRPSVESLGRTHPPIFSNLSGDVQRELSQFVGPNLSGVDKVAVSF
jgi:hypothetical protein